jgi:hypothetical protein
MSSSSPNGFEHREAYLHELMAAAMRPMFTEHGATIPGNIRIACGFPLGGRRTIGQCFPAAHSADGFYEIFISPVLADAMRVAGCLAHELIHPTVGLKEGHKGPFKQLALAIGLTGPMTATQEGEAFKRQLAPILESLGPYPHAELNPWKRVAEQPDAANVPGGFKPQGTRLLKVMCACGYTVRVTQKWLNVGPPHCPMHGAMARR